MIWDELSDLRSHIAHLEEANAGLQKRLATLEAAFEQVIDLGATVDSSGRTTIRQEMARRKTMQQRRAAQSAQESI